MKGKPIYSYFPKLIPIIFISLTVSEILRVSIKSQSCDVEGAHVDSLRSFTCSLINHRNIHATYVVILPAEVLK